jgi:hypothetical protein
VHQDNQSAMLLENHGRMSSSRRTRHIEIRYFFVTDQIAKKNLRVTYCPTDDMLADFFTKPLQGAKFWKFRNMIMNLPSHDVESSRKECVGTNKTCIADDVVVNRVDGPTSEVHKATTTTKQGSSNVVHNGPSEDTTSWVEVVRRGRKQMIRDKNSKTVTGQESERKLTLLTRQKYQKKIYNNTGVLLAL